MMDYLSLSFQRFITRWRRKSVLNVKVLEDNEHKGQIKKVRNILLGSYKPEPYLGKVRLYSVTNRPWYIRWDPMSQWTNIVKSQLEIVSIKGDHMSVLKPPLVTQLTEDIDTQLPGYENE